MKTRFGFIVLAAAFVWSVSGCSGHRSSESSPPAAAVDPATAGLINGSVTLDGAPPALKPIDMSASPACVQANPSPVLPPIIVTGDKGALANVVVYVKDAPGNYRYDTPADTVVLRQKNCMYEPHVVALMTGQPFEVQNNDPTMHNVHPMPKRNRQWSTSQPAGSAALKETFTRPEFAMQVLCNVHPWMRSTVFVFDHPYFAVTPNTGGFELKNLPPGNYTIEAWHETLGTQDQAVTVAPRESKTISFTFKSP
ncbi:MAG: carboxypeptidase regulatory-like domain-containing protein [Candidatus Acidiferrales bacterium]